jgi:hypothetical protein
LIILFMAQRYLFYNKKHRRYTEGTRLIRLDLWKRNGYEQVADVAFDAALGVADVAFDAALGVALAWWT